MQGDMSVTLISAYQVWSVKVLNIYVLVATETLQPIEVYHG